MVIQEEEKKQKGDQKKCERRSRNQIIEERRELRRVSNTFQKKQTVKISEKKKL